jgi:FKBP-type peptidyl-prolyl cis-trans isomerase 2/predicted Fe-Mo cluster-binding NifX family protein
MLIAIPSESPGGLDAAVSPHFGHCQVFTLVQVENGRIGETTLLENQAHEGGACMAPVMMLKENEVEALIAGGMGQRPLAGFQQVGITVYHNEEAATVREAVQRVIEGKARVFGEAQTCGGGGGGCGSHHHHHEPVEREPIEGKADIRDGRVVTFHYSLREKDGELLDASERSGPMRYLHGHENIVPGLEKALAGLVAGDHRVVELSSSEAYGDRDDSRVMEVPLTRLPPNPQVGAVLQGRHPDGQVVGLVVVEVGETTARLDGNHPLAGKHLVFDVTVVSVESATEEELAHGHVH